MKPMPKEIAEYFAQFDPETRKRLAAIREALLELVPDAEEAIKYRMPTVMRDGNLLHYAAFKSHIGLYPLPETLESLKRELARYKQGKGSIQFPNDEPLPLDAIRAIAKERIRLREAERSGKAKKARA